MKDEGIPTNHDLHVEVIEQKIVLQRIDSSVTEIKDVLLGKDKRSGLLVDVDRLKRTSATTRAIIWVLFTTILGAGASIAVAAMISQ